MIYDPDTDAWEVGAPMPIQAEHLTVAAAAGRIFAFSGRWEGLRRSEVQAYDPASDTWELVRSRQHTRPSRPTRVAGLTF
jgi:hypothetical protein